MFQSLALDQTPYARTTFDSWEHGWRSLLLRRFSYRDQMEEVAIPPVAEQLVSLLIRGEATVESQTGGGWVSARTVPGTISMTAPDRPSQLRWRNVAPEPLESLELHLPAGTTGRLAEELWDRDIRQLNLPDELATTDPVLEQTLLGLLRAAEGGLPDLYAETAVEFLTVHTLTQHGRLPAPRTAGAEDERIRRARAFLRENLHLPLSLTAIAAEMGMSRYHFLRVFQRQTGETPHRFLTRLRIEQGRHDLEHGTATVIEIASRCGFASPSHFATTFRRHTGYSPSSYRSLHRRVRS